MPASERWSSLAACSLTLLAPFVIFLRHHDYALLRVDSALAAGCLLAAGLLFGVVLAWGPAILRVGIAALFVFLFIDLQTDWLEESLRAGFSFASIALLLWLARRHLGRGIAFVAAIVLLTSLPMEPGNGWIQRRSSPTIDEPRADLPPLVHIVLDEQVAIGAIPETFDPNGRVREAFGRAYLDLGFRVFTHAFSRHFTTPPSLSHLLNLGSSDRTFEFYDPQTKRVTQNAYFRALAERGYRIRVLQTDYIDFCGGADESLPAHCLTYTLESIKAVESSGLGLGDRVQAILGSFGQLSSWLQSCRRSYRERARGLEAHGITLPEWPLRAARLSTLSSKEMLPILEAELASAGPGTATFAHLLLPHFPYAFDRACELRPSPLDWRTYKAPSLRPTRNNRRTRAERYRLYLEQLECTNRLVTEMLGRVLQNEALRDALVIVHGDHGSRINLTTPNQLNLHRMSNADYADAFATHFAYRAPALDAALDSRSIAIEALLREIAMRGGVPTGMGWAGSTNVYITGDRADESVQRTMRWPETGTD